MEMKIYSNEDSGDVVFNNNEIGVVNIDLNHISLDDNFDKDDPDTIVLVRHLAWHIKFEKGKALKKELNKELTPAAWHPNRWWHWCKSENEKKGNKSNFYWRVIKVCVGRIKSFNFFWIIYIKIVLRYKSLI